MSDQMSQPDITVADVREALHKTHQLMQRPEQQDRYISVWEKLWHTEIPNMAEQLQEMLDAMDQEPGFKITYESAPVLAEMFQGLARALEAAEEGNAPNPDLVALFYLRKIEARLIDMDERLRDMEGRI